MRVANIIEEGRIGGPQLRMVRVAVAMRGRVDTVIVMPRENGAPFASLCERSGVPYRAYAITRITRQLGPALRFVASFPVELFVLARAFRREGVDLVHVSGGSWQFKGIISAWLAGVPSIWHLNDTLMPGWVRSLFRLFAPLASGFVFASNRSREYYGNLVPDRPQTVITSTVDTDRFSPEATLTDDEDVIARLGDAPVVGIVANVNRIKGLETLIRATQQVRRQVPDVRVVVIGAIHGNQRRYHQDLVALAAQLGVSDAVEWVGGREDVRPLVKRMDVYVCSSLSESSPASVWEAMAMARPVVSTRVGDVPLHLVDGECGYLVDVEDHGSMAARIVELLEDPAKRARFGSAARKVAEEFSPAKVAEKTERFYRDILGRNMP